MIKTYLSKTSIFKTFAAVCIFGISISGCTSKKKTPMETTDTTENELTMLVGTYTSGTSKGIYSYRFNEEDGTATPLSETEIENPSYLVPSADGKFVYTSLEELLNFLESHMSNEAWPPEQVRAYFEAQLPKLNHWKQPEA